jgi:hypothetical protein
LPPDPDILSVPTDTLIFRQNGLEVAVVGEDDRIVVKKISIGRNLGTRVEVLSGVTPSDRVVVSPPDSLAAGDLVRIAGEATVSGNRPGSGPDTEENLPADAKATEQTR